MNIQGWAEIAVTIGLSVVCGWPLGIYMAKRVGWAGSAGWRRWRRSSIAHPASIRKGVKAGSAYTLSFLAFSTAAFLFLYAILRLQQHLPLNPGGFAGFSPDLAFNTAISFVTNTNWQFYSGESAASHLTQMAGLTVQNFASVGRRHRRGCRSGAGFRQPIVEPASATSGPTWCASRSTSCCPCRSWLRSSSARWAFPRPCSVTSTPPPWRARNSPSRLDPSPARRRSSRSARMAAASSTPIPRILSRTPTRSPTSSRR